MQGMRKNKKLWIVLGAVVILAFAGTATWLIHHREGADANLTQEKAEANQSEQTTANTPCSIWIMGDSLAAESHGRAYLSGTGWGWGMMLEKYLLDDVIVKNAAVNGASSSSYLETSSYEMAMEELQKGDYVIIQFGHNDAWYEDRLTDPIQSSKVKGSFKSILKNNYIKPILDKGCHVVLATSVVANAFDETGELYQMNYYYHAQAMRDLAKECQKEDMEVTLIDTYALTDALYRQIGQEQAGKLHSDTVHYNAYGAAYAAGLIAQQMQEAGLACCQNICTFDEVVEETEGLRELEEKEGITLRTRE